MGISLIYLIYYINNSVINKLDITYVNTLINEINRLQSIVHERDDKISSVIGRYELLKHNYHVLRNIHDQKKYHIQLYKLYNRPYINDDYQ